MFQSDRDGNRELYVMAADGGDPRRLTRHPAADDHPAWAPDGLRIAFAARTGDDYEIYVLEVETAIGDVLICQNVYLDRTQPRRARSAGAPRGP